MSTKRGPCPHCDGNKQDPDNPEVACPTCGGTGWVEIYPDTVTGDK